MTGWFQRFLAHTFQGKQLMTEEVLEHLREDLRKTRGQLADILQEVTLAMQALDVMDMRMQRTDQVMRTPPPPPVVLTNNQRQRQEERA